MTHIDTFKFPLKVLWTQMTYIYGSVKTLEYVICGIGKGTGRRSGLVIVKHTQKKNGIVVEKQGWGSKSLFNPSQE